MLDNADMERSDFIKRVQDRVSALGEGPVTLALKGGLERNFIRDILENKKRSVRAESLRKLAMALEVDPEWLSTGREAATTDRERRFLTHFRGLSDDRQEAWLRLLEADAEPDPDQPPKVGERP